MSEAEWLASANPYSKWNLWRHWMPKPSKKVETVAEVIARQIGGKPEGYSWALWYNHKTKRKAIAIA